MNQGTDTKCLSLTLTSSSRADVRALDLESGRLTTPEYKKGSVVQKVHSTYLLVSYKYIRYLFIRVLM